MRIVLNVKALEKHMSRKGFNKSSLTREMGIHRASLYKVMEGKRGAGNEFIARLLHVFDDLAFEDLFFLDTTKTFEHVERGEQSAN